jgi:hypothetical protein
MSSSSSDQTSLNLTEKLGEENSTTVSQYFLSLALEYQKLKQALKKLAEEKKIDLNTSYLLLENTKKKGSKYELQFLVKNSNNPIILETDEAIFYSFKETFNTALNKAKSITGDEESTRASAPSLNREPLEIVDAASLGTAIAALIEFSTNDEEPISSLTTTLQIQAYYGLFQSGLTLGQGAFQIAQVVSDLAGNKFISLSEKIGNKILNAATKTTGSTKTALSAMGKVVSNSLTVAAGVISLGLEIAAIAQLSPGDIGFVGSVTNLSFSLISFGLGLTSILAGSVVSSFAGALTIPVAGLGFGLGALIQLTGKQWENCFRLGEYTIELEKSYLNFLSKQKNDELNLVDGYVIVKEVNLEDGKVQLDTPWLPQFIPSSPGTALAVNTHVKGDSWEVNYKSHTNRDLPLSKYIIKTFSLIQDGIQQVVILPVLPYYKMHIEKVGVGVYYSRRDKEIMALPMLSGSEDRAWGFFGTGYIIGFTGRPQGAIEYLKTTVKVIGSTTKDDTLITPSLEDNNGQDNNFISAIRNLLTYEIHKSYGTCLLAVSKYAKYQVTLGERATLLIKLPEVDRVNIERQNGRTGKITFGGSSWVEINFPEPGKLMPPVIIIDHKGKRLKVNFVTQSCELISIDSKLYYEATGKSVEKELIGGRILDPLIPSLPPTIPITNAAKDYNRPQDSQRCSYGFYFKSVNQIRYLDSPGELPQSLAVIKCLPDQVVLRQKVRNEHYSFSEEDLGQLDYLYYVKKDNDSFQIKFSGQSESQSFGYLINGQLPKSRMRGILKDGCPDCGSGNIVYHNNHHSFHNPYRDPSFCRDCKKRFPRYIPDPNVALHTALGSVSEYDEVHSQLLAWGLKSEGVYYEYVNLVIDASESNYYAEQQGSNISKKLDEVKTEFRTVDGAEKKEALKELYWSLSYHQCIYLRLLLTPDLINSFLVPFQITQPSLNYKEWEALARELRAWSGSSGPRHEYVEAALELIMPTFTLLSDHSISVIKRILEVSPRVVEELNQDKEKLYRLLLIYREPPYNIRFIYREPPNGSREAVWQSHIRAVFAPLPSIVAFLDNPSLQPHNPPPQLQGPYIRPTLPIIDPAQRDRLFSALDIGREGSQIFRDYANVLRNDIYYNQVRDEEEMMQMAQSLREQLSISGSTDLAQLLLIDNYFSEQESVRVYMRLLLRPPVASLLPDLPPGTIEKYFN